MGSLVQVHLEAHTESLSDSVFVFSPHSYLLPLTSYLLPLTPPLLPKFVVYAFFIRRTDYFCQ